jgi:hypothetical protein
LKKYEYTIIYDNSIMNIEDISNNILTITNDNYHNEKEQYNDEQLDKKNDEKETIQEVLDTIIKPPNIYNDIISVHPITPIRPITDIEQYNNKKELWKENTEIILELIQKRCLELSNQHKYNYVVMKRISERFKAPTIVLSGIATFFSFGLQSYLSQQQISIICSCITFVTGLLGTLELWLGLPKKMEKELILSKALYMLYMDITKVLTLDKDLRKESPEDFYEKKFEIFQQIIENSDIMPGDLFKKIPEKILLFKKNSICYNDIESGKNSSI